MKDSEHLLTAAVNSPVVAQEEDIHGPHATIVSSTIPKLPKESVLDWELQIKTLHTIVYGMQSMVMRRNQLHLLQPHQ